MPAKPAPKTKPAAEKPEPTETEKKAPVSSPEDVKAINAWLDAEYPNARFKPPNEEPEKPPGEGEESPVEPGEGEEAEGTEKPVSGKKPAPKPGAKPAVKPKPAPAAAQPPAAAVDPEKIAEAAARGVVQGLEKSKEKEIKEKTKALIDDLSPADKDRIAVLHHMIKLWPEKYNASMIDRFAKGANALAEYAEKWEAEHPGEEFDPESNEHEDFFTKHKAFEEWDERDFHKAEVKMEVAAELEKVKPGQDSRVDELQRELKLMKSEATIGQKQTAAAIAYWELFGDEFADIVAPNGAVNATKLTELKNKAPAAMNIRVQAGSTLNAEVAEITKLYQGLITFNPDTNIVHKAIADFGKKYEDKMLRQPPEQRLDDQGRPFMPGAKYNRLSEADREKYWTFQQEDLIALRTKEVAELVKASIEHQEAVFRAEAKARGLIQEEDQPGAGASPEDAEKITAEADAAERRVVSRPRVEKPNSPSSAPESRGAAARAGQRNAPAANGGVTLGSLGL